MMFFGLVLHKHLVMLQEQIALLTDQLGKETERSLSLSGELFQRANDIHQLKIENERLLGLRPEAPPRPPDGEGLPRYGLRWNGPQQPVAVPMADGYWTPWHLAERIGLNRDMWKAQVERQAKTIEVLRNDAQLAAKKLRSAEICHPRAVETLVGEARQALACYLPNGWPEAAMGKGDQP